MIYDDVLTGLPPHHTGLLELLRARGADMRTGTSVDRRETPLVAATAAGSLRTLAQLCGWFSDASDAAVRKCWGVELLHGLGTACRFGRCVKCNISHTRMCNIRWRMQSCNQTMALLACLSVVIADWRWFVTWLKFRAWCRRTLLSSHH
eukprot:SAG11_NODE_1752_length_4316_cov_4.210576_3_plen_149_part_00